MNHLPLILARLFSGLMTMLTVLCLPGHAAEPKLSLKENDLWVMAGDSITAQRLHTNYIEAYYQTRYPKLNLRFRNSGIGGNRTSHLLQRFDYDVAAWKPAIVSVELGMNDVNNGDDPSAYIKGIGEIVARIRAIPAQPILLSSSPVDDGSLSGAWKSERCRRIDLYTEALKKFAAGENILFVDQFHPLLELWGNNRRKGTEAATKSEPPPEQAGQGRSQRLAPALIPLGGNPVHPGVIGQYTMAAVILAGLGAEGDVSTATLKADGTVVEAKRCRITESSGKNGKLSFTRLDEAGPWPILPSARNVTKLMPALLNLSRYMVKVSGLPEGRYRITVNGTPTALVESRDLAAGWNMTTAFDGVFGERATRLLSLLDKLQVKLNNDWRAASKAGESAKMAAAQSAIEACESEIRAAAQPIPLRFEIEQERP